MSEEQKEERYLIIFNFGSFVYMFFIIGFATGLVLAIGQGLYDIATEPSLSTIGWAAASLIMGPFGYGLGVGVTGMLGYFPYRWLCKRGWGWPTKGIFIKVPEPAE